MMKLFGKRDIWIILAALCVCGAAALLFAQNAGDEVRIYVGEELYTAASLNVDKVIDVSQPDGCRNVICIENGRVHMQHSTCDNQLCVQQGYMDMDSIKDRPLQNWIICLPNRVTVELCGEDE